MSMLRKCKKQTVKFVFSVVVTAALIFLYSVLGFGLLDEDLVSTSHKARLTGSCIRYDVANKFARRSL